MQLAKKVLTYSNNSLLLSNLAVEKYIIFWASSRMGVPVKIVLLGVTPVDFRYIFTLPKTRVDYHFVKTAWSCALFCWNYSATWQNEVDRQTDSGSGIGLPITVQCAVYLAEPAHGKMLCALIWMKLIVKIHVCFTLCICCWYWRLV